MRWSPTRFLVTLAAAAMASACAATPAQRPHATMAAYADEAHLQQALERWREQARSRRERRDAPAASGESLAMPAAPAPQMAARAAAPGVAGDSITNVQTAGVDEGGIVKRAGDFLVVLRRGRLHTVRIGGDALRATATTDAYAPGIDPSGAWYDELLVAGDTVVVIGYSYARGGTEIGLFRLAPDGTLSHRSTYHLRSFDYYSARNYASRLIGRTLVFYTPTLLQPWARTPTDAWPAMRAWHGNAAAPFERILPAQRIHRTDDDFDPAQPLALHTVTRCELGDATMRCESTAVLGPAGRVFYVSEHAVYVWTAGSRPGTAARALSAVFRIPLDGAAPSALKTAGVPIDALSFLEDAGGHLNVLLRDWGAGDGMWGNERTRGAMALLRVPLAAFGDGRDSALPQHYRPLPSPAGGSLQNRYVGDWLLWGANEAWAVRYAGGAPIALAPGQRVERIEALGEHAVIIGNAADDLRFSSVRLDGRDARVVATHAQPGARQGETRTHGFFFRPTGPDEGLLGLPITSAGHAGRGIYRATQGSAAVVYLRVRGLAFGELGQLVARPDTMRDDACRASCVDWYGNARPIFVGERVFALLGYELVEGRLAHDAGTERIAERRRVDFSPAGARE